MKLAGGTVRGSGFCTSEGRIGTLGDWLQFPSRQLTGTSSAEACTVAWYGFAFVLVTTSEYKDQSNRRAPLDAQLKFARAEGVLSIPLSFNKM